jgi:hypothetical protein
MNNDGCNILGIPTSNTEEVTSYTSKKANRQTFSKAGKITDLYISEFGNISISETSKSLYDNKGGFGTLGLVKKIYTDKNRGQCVETEKEVVCEKEITNPGKCKQNEIFFEGVCHSFDKDSVQKRVTGIETVETVEGRFNFGIDANAEMESMFVGAKFVGDISELESNLLAKSYEGTFKWYVSVEYWDGTYKGQHFITSGLDRRRSGRSTNDFIEFQVENVNINHTFTKEYFKENNIFGGGADGTGEVSIALSDGRLLKHSRLFQIWGAEPTYEIKFDYLQSPEMKAIGSMETRKLTHFKINTPAVSFDGGFGAMQLTLCNGLPTYRQIWSWKENLDGGRDCLNSKFQAARYHLNNIIGAGNYTYDQLVKEALQRYNGSYYYDNIGGNLQKSKNCIDYLRRECTYGDIAFSHYLKYKQ